ncbi:MAG: uracil-DNA glycosylase [Acidobacteriota bacterium]
MARALDSATRDALAERLRFYRELGLVDLYRRPINEALLAQLESAGIAVAEPASIPPQPQAPAAPAPPVQSASELAPHSATPQPNFIPEEPAIPPRKSISAPPQIGSTVAPEDRSAALLQIVEEIGDCKRCPLHKERHSIVFGQGDPNARLMFVGEGPGADEDAQGLPFVGRAGQLLNNMIAAMGLKREETYICNVVKCRPPGNRTPEPDEANTCSPFLFRQIDVVRPQVIVALGATAATYLLGQRQPLAGLRGRVHAFRGSSLIVTYHPAYLLRDPRQKKEAWADLQIAMKELGLKAPTRG